MTSSLLQHDFRSEVGYWVHMTAHRLERAVNAELATEGITYRQCQVLAWLSIDGDLAQIDLADRMNVEPPTLVKVLDCMERAGLIERVGCPEDRRRKVVRPTQRAVPVWEKIVACANRVRDRSVRGLTSDEVGTLRGLLEKVHDNLADSSAGSPGRTPDRETPVGTVCEAGHKTLGPHGRRVGVTGR
jgi:MarR family transcriptional regulator for hemolysin